MPVASSYCPTVWWILDQWDLNITGNGLHAINQSVLRFSWHIKLLKLNLNAWSLNNLCSGGVVSLSGRKQAWKLRSRNIPSLFNFHAYLKFLTDQEGIPADLSTCAASQRAHVNSKSGKQEDESNIKWILLSVEDRNLGCVHRSWISLISLFTNK